MAKLRMLIGLPGSGKSTYAKSFMARHPDWTYLSSDQISEEVTGKAGSGQHQDIFEVIAKRAIFAIKSDQDVLYDGTNLSFKKRRAFLERLYQYDVDLRAVVFLVPYDLVKSRNEARVENRVPKGQMERYIQGFQFPTPYEGFQAITILPRPQTRLRNFQTVYEIRNLVENTVATYEEIKDLYSRFQETQPIVDLEQEHPRGFTVSRHMYEVYRYIQQHVKDKDECNLLSWVALLHDIGKAYTKRSTQNEVGFSIRFPGHEHVSMYLAYSILSSLHFSDSFITNALLLIDQHQAPYDKVKLKKWQERVGQKNYERLQIILAANQSA